MKNNRPHSIRIHLSQGERADLGRALDLTRATPRALLMTAATATIRDVEAVSACVRIEEQQTDADLARATDTLRSAERSGGFARLCLIETRALLRALRERSSR